MQQVDFDHINHVGMAVRDLALATATFEAMGFQLTPYSPQSAAWKPGDAVKPLASGNRCIMFADNYLEVLGSENPKQQAPRIANFLARHQGAHIICFNSENPHAVDQRLHASQIETSGVIPLQRDIDTPDGVKTAKFERVQFAPNDSPEGYIQSARHLTPEYIYQPRYIVHPNGCTKLVDTIVVVDDLDRFSDRYTRYIGAPLVREGRVARFDFALGSRLTLVHWRDAAALLPGTLFAPVPCIAAVSFRAPDLRAVRERLLAKGFTPAEVGERLVVPAEQASGVAVVFEV